MHILVSECISKGLNEEEFAQLNTAKKVKKMFKEKKRFVFCNVIIRQL